MKINIYNFRPLAKRGNGDELATVDITERKWGKKRSYTANIFFSKTWGTWYFADNGELVNEECLRKALRIYKARDEYMEWEKCEVWKDK